jgi:hypothetical protein
MKTPIWTMPAIWGVVAGGIAMSTAGFSYFGWHTARDTRSIAEDSARAATTAAQLPICIAKARADADPALLAKLRAETSSYTRGEIVRTAGWATLPGMVAADTNLASACSERLMAPAG